MKTELVLSCVLALLVLLATTIGIFFQSPGSPAAQITVRGDLVLYQGSGLYRYDPAWFAREGVVWDVINLSLGLPLLGLAVWASNRGSLRGRLLLAGLLFYFFYVYLMAATGYAFNALFLVYVAVFALSAVAFFINLQRIEVAGLPACISDRFPRRLFVGYTLVAAASLVIIWFGRIIPIMISGRFPPEVAGLPTLVSQGIDLGMVVPLLLSSGILLWHKSPLGYLLVAVSLSYGLLMCVTIPAWIAVPLIQDGKINPIEAAPLLIVCAAGPVLAGLFFRHVLDQDKQSCDTMGAAVAG